MALARCNFVITDEDGNIVDGASVAVRRMTPGQPLIVPYSDRDGLVSLGNPYVAADGAEAGFFAAGGSYMITATLGAFTRTWSYVAVGLAAESDTVSVAGVQFSFDTGTSDADPGTGELRGSNASLASAGFLYISKTNRFGDDVSAFLLALTGKSLVINIDGVTSQVTFIAGAVTDASGYVKVAVSGQGGATSISAGAFLGLSTSGPAGISGTGAMTRVRAVAVANVVIATALENGDAIDGVTLATNDLVLLTGQSTTHQNGVYVVSASGAATRHTDFDTYDELPGTYFSVMEGTVFADTLWRCTSNRGGTIGVTALAFTRFQGDSNPSTDDGQALGTTALRWSDLFLALGAVINFNNGDVALTHSADNLAVSGGVLEAAGGLNVSGGGLAVPAGSVTNTMLAASARAFQSQLLHVREQQAANTAGGTFTNGAWRTRVLNTEVTNEITGASLGSNQITLPAGTYFIQARAPASVVAANKAKLANITDTADTIIGPTEMADPGVVQHANATVVGRFTIAAQKVFELQHRCGTTRATNGFGQPSNLGVVEVYSEVMIWKVA